MKELTIKNLRRAIAYVARGCDYPVDITDISDDSLQKMDLYKDLHMGNIRIVNVLIELNRVYGLDLSMDIFKSMPDNSVGSLLNATNGYIRNNF